MNEQKENKFQSSIKIDENHINLIEKLSNACAVSGDEREIRNIIRESIDSEANEITVDAMGNMLVHCKSGEKDPLKVMLSAHMDEVGFMLVEDDKNGLFRFATVGGIDIRQIVGKAVSVGHEHHAGIIGACPIHLVEQNELHRTISIDTLRIDLGPSSEDVKAGDRATFATKFVQSESVMMGKALDNRLGVAILIELIKQAPFPIELMAAFTVQEEVGLRGAGVAAYSYQPDIAIAVDCTPAFDLPDWEDEENVTYNTRLREGPAIYLADRGTISDRRLVDFLSRVAGDAGIPYQYRQPGGGGTDAGAMHLQRTGIPSVSISVPGRYPHTAAMLACYEDWLNTLKLLQAALQKMDKQILKDAPAAAGG